ncbi:hypothetical protein DFP73DRAFT_620564 [Morchella snyderi]|nr:hypothetical protein DFP73DRAFT_620564 [Morchella snyderi]
MALTCATCATRGLTRISPPSPAKTHRSHANLWLLPASPPPARPLPSIAGDSKGTTNFNKELNATAAVPEASQPSTTPASAASTSTPTPATTTTTPTPAPIVRPPPPPSPTTTRVSPAPTQAASTTITTTRAPPAPGMLPHPPLSTACGRGCASPELFQKLTKPNWHGRLGRALMADVDALPDWALFELDCLLRRKLHAILPWGGGYAAPDADMIFASLAALGLRLQDRGAYADVPVLDDGTLLDQPTLRRGTNVAAWYASRGMWGEYWQGMVETVLELARYRGLFDDEGFVKTG